MNFITKRLGNVLQTYKTETLSSNKWKYLSKEVNHKETDDVDDKNK